MIGVNMSAHNIIKSYLRRATKDSLLGVGCYSAAILANNSRDQVVKIGSCNEDPWLDYYYEIVNCVRTVHTPKVHRLYAEEDNYYYVALMEHLQPLDSANAIFVTLVQNYISNSLAYSKLLESASQLSSIPDPEAFISFIDYLIDRTDVIEKGAWNDYPEDARTLDIHAGNWMLRKDGTLVLNDPWAHYEITEDLERWAEDNLYTKYGYPA